MCSIIYGPSGLIASHLDEVNCTKCCDQNPVESLLADSTSTWQNPRMRSLYASLLLPGVLGVVCSAATVIGAGVKEIVSEAVFLGGEKREWAVFEGREAKGMELRVKFEGKGNA